jgi:capsular polysaccharide biosynthesis protein
MSSLSRLSGSLGALSSLSSLSNLALPASPSQTQLELYLAAVQSVPVATDLVNQPYIAHGVFWRDWDDEKRVWERPSEIKSLIVNAGKAVLDMPIRDWHPPDGPQMAKALSEFVTVDYQRTSPIVTITYKDRDPQFGVSLLLALHKAADSRLRTRVVQRTATYIDYLQQQLRVVTSAEQRTALINALTNQEELRMAAMANVSYSVDVLVPPTPSIRPTDPNPYVYVVLFTLLGAIAGAGYILYRK